MNSKTNAPASEIDVISKNIIVDELDVLISDRLFKNLNTTVILKKYIDMYTYEEMKAFLYFKLKHDNMFIKQFLLEYEKFSRQQKNNNK